ncbi:hypothetical protein [Bacillus sp. THAF10]|uniref:hypothetical protein n=1 Tax=Bacillus sp. THAF10 TaxID=2587848 RepID=UPI001268CDB1|nr:hypothetical protein [Bacillus sp. THAF10]
MKINLIASLKIGIVIQEIDTLQIFFDTDLTDADVVNILDLNGGILQVETSFDWYEFSKLEFSKQQVDLLLLRLERVRL